jgi:hypothetical protein
VSEAPLCKKHQKERTVIYDRPMPRGGTLRIVGCEDCAAEAQARLKELDSSQGVTAPSQAKSETKEEKKAPPSSPKVRSIGDRFGFKF